MLQKVLEFVSRHNMLGKDDKVIAGISGGADSVCLLCVLKDLQLRYGFSLEAVHVNHMLRGAEAEEDARFTKELCRQMQVPCTVYAYPVADLARKQGRSVEEMGRIVRYRAFCQRLLETGFNKIAVAHQMDDQAETMLWNLFRGGGLRGLAAMGPVSRIPFAKEAEQGRLIRPLLCLERKEIEACLKERGLPFRTDATNLEDGYTRNKIRRHVLSYVKEEILPSVSANMERSAEQFARIRDFLDKTAENALELYGTVTEEGLRLSLDGLEKLDPAIQRELVRVCLSRTGESMRDITMQHIESVMALAKGATGKQLCLPKGRRVMKSYGDLIFTGEKKQTGLDDPKKSSPTELDVLIPGSYLIPESGEKLVFTKKSFVQREKIPDSQYTKWFDYDKIRSPLKLRGRKPGDYLTVNGDGGTKKLKDYLIDCKYPRHLRDRLILIAEGSHVLWVPGLRISEAYKITKETRTILEIKRIVGKESKNERANFSDDTGSGCRRQDPAAGGKDQQ